MPKKPKRTEPRLTIDDLCDDGVYDLCAAIINSAKREFIFAYINWVNVSSRPKVLAGVKRDAADRLVDAGKFFHTPLFEAMCDIPGDEYIRNMKKNAVKLWREFQAEGPTMERRNHDIA